MPDPKLTSYAQELVTLINGVKQTMLDVVHGNAKITLHEGSYDNHYASLRALLEIFRDEGIELANPNLPETLRGWYTSYTGAVYNSNSFAPYGTLDQCKEHLRMLFAPLADPLTVALLKFARAQSEDGFANDLRAKFPLSRASERFDPTASPIRQALKLLHPAVIEKCEKLFADGHYADAVLASMKVVEDAIRARCGAGPEVYGTDLVSAAMNGSSSSLRFGKTDAEHAAAQLLFRGAIGWFRNPAAHRFIAHDSPLQVQEILAFASLLVRMVETA